MMGGGGGGQSPTKMCKIISKGVEGGWMLSPFPSSPQTENESNHDMHLQCQGGLAWLDLFF